MAQTISKISRSQVISSLDTYNHTALANSMYMVNVQMNEIPPSGLSIAIKQNGTTKVTSIAPAAAQSAISVQIVLNCSVNDIIGVVVSSANASDTGRNVVKGLINIHQGSS